MYQKIKTSKYVLKLFVLVPYGLYLWASTRLWLVDNHNDFGEYFTRAELWSRGKFVYSGGGDKLLSIIELMPVVLFRNDFIVIYRCLQVLVITILFSSIFAFVNSKATLLPPPWQRAAACLIFLLHPVFLISAITVDESVVLTAMLLLFVSFYDRPLLSVIFAFLCLYARPEGLIVLPLFFVLAGFSEVDDRGRIVKSAVVALLGFIMLKSVEIALFATKQEYSFLGVLSTVITGHAHVAAEDVAFTQSLQRFLGNLVVVPLIPIIIAAEVFPQLIVFVLFCIGVCGKISRKAYVPLSGILLFHSGLISVLFWAWSINIEDKLNPAVSNVSWWSHSLTLDLQEPEAFGWPRYYLFDYPALAIFLVAGAGTVSHWIGRTFGYWISTRSSRSHRRILPGGTIALGLALTLAYGQGYQDLLLSGKYFWPHNLLPIDEAGIAIRRLRSDYDEAVLFDGLCDATQGSMPSIFSVHSGVIRKFMRVCDDARAFASYERGLRLLSGPPFIISSEEVNNLGSDRKVIFEDYIVDIIQTVADAGSGQLDEVFSVDRAALKKNNIRFIVSIRSELQYYDWLESIGKYGPYYVYMVAGGTPKLNLVPSITGRLFGVDPKTFH